MSAVSLRQHQKIEAGNVDKKPRTLYHIAKMLGNNPEDVFRSGRRNATRRRRIRENRKPVPNPSFNDAVLSSVARSIGDWAEGAGG